MGIQAESITRVQEPAEASTSQITVLDTGGQYTHLIARKVRELGVYADVQPSDLPAEQLRSSKGIIISGGPASVYEPGCPDIDPIVLRAGVPVLGICYGHQLLAHHLGGKVQKGERGEYGLAHLTITSDDALWNGVRESQIWMSHRDSVAAVPAGFRVTASTSTSAIAAMSSPERKLFGVQFHPEVVHTHAGKQILENFIFRVCGATRDWDVSQRIPVIEEQIRSIARNRNIFFFVSGGVDSTVAYTLCLRALGPERVYGIYVDTGLMRKGETELVSRAFHELGAKHFLVDNAEEKFLAALAGIEDPEEKRRAIGEQFVKVQERILATQHFLDGHWILGQGTIYPDTIESGGTAKADLIKTHHNRVAGIQALVESGKIIEPLAPFYKDEVREIGRELGVPDKILARHPFPGPGLGIRCLCANAEGALTETSDGFLLPVRSVGVQGDCRSYRNVFALPRKPTLEDIQATAPALINSRFDVNRIVAICGSKAPMASLQVFEASITKDRLEALREADAIVRDLSVETGFEEQVWQFPVVLLPVGTETARESVVLRPVNSVDGMTADAVLMDGEILDALTAKLLNLPRIAAVFYDLTHKPPGTIEWE
ncbi:MAG: glutamine-hydrolyzing GMP synthase [Acidobacteriaceae bacterium]|nr:glutamine-hydrolyzing GMP synthase [Acidobacteriaceae bacterium]MBV9779608.1 glutamine-hydrolyzing GMP synthase [Acidobacteriaceae bacterium]